MPHSPRRARRALVAATLLVVFAVAGAPARAADVPAVSWSPCRDARGFECAKYTVPRDYDRPADASLQIALTRLPARDQAHRIGSLFVNFGGPGAAGVDGVKALGRGLFGALNQRFDIVGFDPRGTGESSSAVNCHANQETDGIYAHPFVTPDNADANALVARDIGYIKRCLAFNAAILPYLSTANVARDLDVLRQAVGDDQLNYLGFSYGTFLGATYASLFPHRYRVMVLDGALDADQYINHPIDATRVQTVAFERAIGRFLAACAATPDACQFGDGDPWAGYDALVERADASPIPASGDDPRPVTGDDIRAATVQAVYAKQLWPLLALALDLAQAGDGVGVRAIADFFYGRLPDGTYDPFTDRFFTISAVELQYPSDVNTFMTTGATAWAMFDHAYFNSGYSELAWGLYPVAAKGIYTGPFKTAGDSPMILVVGNTYDPATPYRGAKRLVAELGQARLLTMIGDGHTAYGLGSDCVDASVNAYLLDRVLPTAGATCRQDVPFVSPFAAASQARALSLGKVHRLGNVLSRFVRR